MRGRTDRAPRGRAIVAAFAAAAIGAVPPTPALAAARAPTGAAPWGEGERSALVEVLNGALDTTPILHGAHVGGLAIDAKTGAVLFARSADGAFQPASTLKLLVGSVALDTFGPQQRFHTDAVVSGPIVDGVLDGKIVVRAGGDPFLQAGDFDALAASVARHGIRTIRDGVAFDVSRYEPQGYPPGWTFDDIGYGYAPIVGALAFEKNVLHLRVTPASSVGAPARLSSSPWALPPGDPFAGCASNTFPLFGGGVTTAQPATFGVLTMQRTPAGCTYFDGTIPLGAAAQVSDAAIPFPTVYAKLVLDDALRRHGVDDLRRTALTHPDLALDRAPPGTPTLWTHDSVALSVTLAELWQRSDNLVAELLLEELGVAAHGMPGTRRSGIAMETSWLSSIDVDESAFAVADGSGLSAYDRISPIALVAILKHDYDGPYRGLVLDALPLAGVRGTLASSWRGTPAERRVFAKTGAVARARALAGYVLNKRHGSIIFAFFVDEWTGDDTALEALEGGLMSALVDG